MKTKEEINVMLNMAREIVKVFRLKGIIHKIEGAEIYKVRWNIFRTNMFTSFIVIHGIKAWFWLFQ